MIRILIVGYCFGIRFERRLRQEVHLNPAYRWFCRLRLEDKVPDHSSVNRHDRFRGSDILQEAQPQIQRAASDVGQGARGLTAIHDALGSSPIPAIDVEHQ